MAVVLPTVVSGKEADDIMRRIAVVLGVVLAAFFIGRAVVELATIDYSDPASYARDWGGPSLAGVLLVHCGLGVISALALLYAWRRSRGDRPTGR